MRGASLNLSDVEFSYAKRRALAGVSLELTPGKVTMLLGPNGAGKSTLFGLLTGLMDLQSGEICFEGRSLKESRASLLSQLGVVFQQSTLDLDLTVEQNLRYHAALRGMSSAEAGNRIREELERFALIEQAKDSVRSLNGGHRRRVELARALLHRPKVLLLDEPTVGLDAHTRQRLAETVRQRCVDSDVAVLWATHLMDEIEDEDQIYLLHKGSMEFSGKAAELKQHAGTDTLVSAFNKLTQFEEVRV